MSEAHARFRESLAAHLAEVLPERDAAWMEAHAAECAECAALLARVRARMPALVGDAAHAPVSLLVRWVREPGSLTALERELLERHLAACGTCREDAAEMSRLAGVVALQPPARRRWRWPLGLVAAAAALAAVFMARLPERTQPVAPAPSAPVPSAPAPASRTPEARTVTLLERSRGASTETVPTVTAPDSGAALRLRVPPLFLPGTQDVQLRLLREDGTLLWESRVGPAALRDTLQPPLPAAGWPPGSYRLQIVPDAGRDTAATREFGFKLLAAPPR